MSDYKVTNPATGVVEKEYPTTTDAQIADVLDRSDAAYRTWRTTSLPERSKVLARVAELYTERAEDQPLARLFGGCLAGGSARCHMNHLFTRIHPVRIP